MKPTSAIRELRESRGLSQEELAHLLGLSLDSVADLERHDDELTTTISLQQAVLLAQSLGLALSELVSAEGGAEPALTAGEARSALLQLMQQQDRDRQSIEDDVGWDMTDFYANPEKTLLERPIMFAQELARVVGVDWIRLLPRTHAA